MSTVHLPRLEPARAPRRQPAREQRPELRLVEPRRRRPSPGRVFAFGAVATLASVLFLTVAGHVMIQQQQQRLDRLTTQARQEQADYNKLRLQVDRMQSPARIVEKARQQGLVQPAVQHWVTPVTPVPAGTGSDSAADGATDDSGDYPQVKPFLGSTR